MSDATIARTLELVAETRAEAYRLIANRDYWKARAERAEAEVARWQTAKGPFDEALADLSSILIAAEHWPDPMRQGNADGSEADFRDACQNIVAGVRLLVGKLPVAEAQVAALTAKLEEAVLAEREAGAAIACEAADEAQKNREMGWQIAFYLRAVAAAIRARSGGAT